MLECRYCVTFGAGALIAAVLVLAVWFTATVGWPEDPSEVVPSFGIATGFYIAGMAFWMVLLTRGSDAAPIEPSVDSQNKQTEPDSSMMWKGNSEGRFFFGTIVGAIVAAAFFFHTATASAITDSIAVAVDAARGWHLGVWLVAYLFGYGAIVGCGALIGIVNGAAIGEAITNRFVPKRAPMAVDNDVANAGSGNYSPVDDKASNCDNGSSASDTGCAGGGSW